MPKMNITTAVRRDYKNERNWTLGENKPNLCHRYQTQSVVPALTCGELVEPSRTACRQSKFPRRSYNRLLPRICRNRRIKLTKTHQFAIISSDLTFFSFILLPFAALLAENCLFLQEPYTTVVV
jgi:hypothetical protein